MIYSSVKSTRDYWIWRFKLEHEADQIHAEAIRRHKIRTARWEIKYPSLKMRSKLAFHLKCANACSKQINGSTQDQFWKLNWEYHLSIAKELNKEIHS